MELFQSLVVLLLSFVTYSVATVPQNLTTLNDLRDFKPLYLGGDMDYFLSNKVATVKDAEKVCKSIGDNYHLITFEKDSEYRRLLPYLRSLDTPKIWTSGIKQSTPGPTPTSTYEWAHPLPKSEMSYTNFPSVSFLSRLSLLEKNFKTRSLSSLPRCRNGFLTPKCTPGNCEVTLDPCTTITPPCTITSCKPCTIQRPDCGATCNNCIVENPVCTVIQEPCEVTTPPCKINRPPCTIVTPPCETIRPSCVTVNPPCEVTSPKPCTTTTRKPCPTEPICTTRIPCTGEKCGPPVTFCKSIFKCDPEPEICFPGAIICPPPVVHCPPEQTVCKSPVLDCPVPVIDCPEPVVNCPLPKTHCTPPKVTCDAPEVNCPVIVENCPLPSYHCPSPIVDCPRPNVDCEDFVPCEYPTPPPPCPSDDPNEFINDDDDADDSILNESDRDCDDCLPSGCIALRKDTDFKWKLEDCSKQFHFICEGSA